MWVPAFRGDTRVSKLALLAQKLQVVGVRGFEPPAPASRTQCSTRLSYTPAKAAHIALAVAPGKPALQAPGLCRLSRLQGCEAFQHGRNAIQHLEQPPLLTMNETSR